MRKIVMILILAFSFCGVPATAYGGVVGCEVAAGMSIPSLPWDFQTYWKTGPHLSAGISYPNGDIFCGLIIVEWDSQPLNRTKLLDDAGVPSRMLSGGGVTIALASINLKVSPPTGKSGAGPYLLAGIGAYQFKIGDLVMTDSGRSAGLPSSTKGALALQLGFGANIPISKAVSLFFDARYLAGVMHGGWRAWTRSAPIRFGVRTR